MCRWVTHLTVVALGAATIALGPSFISGRHIPRDPAANSANAAEAAAAGRQMSARGGGYLVRAAVPRTVAGAEASGELAAPTSVSPSDPASASTPAPLVRSIQTYTVQKGDTVIGLAERFGVSPDTVLAANPSLAGNPDLLQLDQQIVILPVSGVLHTVAVGDTLAGIAQRYKVSTEAIYSYGDNGLVEPYILHPGQRIVVPGGVLPPAPSRAAPGTASQGGANPNTSGKATGSFLWPTTGRLTQAPWGRHMAIDIGAPTGTPIIASDSGYVLEAGWSNVGYGQYVILDHGNGYRSLYAHMSTIIAKKGQWYQKGQRIGLVGSTGNSTGPHLHFEIYRNGVIQNPLNYLP